MRLTQTTSDYCGPGTAVGLMVVGLFATSLHASPSVSSVDGEARHGETLTIEGSGFGSRTDGAPLLMDMTDTVWTRGEPADPYAGLEDGATVPTDSAYPWRGNTEGFFKISRDGDSAPNGSSHYKATIGKNRWGDYRDAFISTPRAFPDPAGNDVRQLYMSWNLRLSFDSTSQSGSHKFIRVWDTVSGSEEKFRLSWTQMHLVVTDYEEGPSWGSARPDPDIWNRMELLIDIDEGIIRAWTNGRLIHDIDDFHLETNRGLQPRLLGWDASGSASYPQETVELSNIYADSTQARVEICDAPTWNECTVKEPQIPTDWETDSITISVNQGRLKTLQDAYVYVVDDEGATNEHGYALGASRPNPPSLRIE